MRTYGFWTGPSAVDQVALRLSEAGLQDVRAGTERVYFKLPAGRPDDTTEAQSAVWEVFPYACYDVEFYKE